MSWALFHFIFSMYGSGLIVALLNLKGVHGRGTATRPSFMSLYVQLSRAERWKGLYLFRKPAQGDFIEPKNFVDEDMRAAVLRLEKLGDETRQSFERDHRHESWFQEWDAMVEAGAATEAASEDDTSLWDDSEDLEMGWPES